MLLDDMAINLDHGATIFKTSDGLGWPNLNLSIVDSRPHDHERMHGGGDELWISMALSPVNTSFILDHKEYHYNLRPNQICIHPPRSVFGTLDKNNSRILHVFLKRKLLSKVMGDLFDHDVSDMEIKSRFGIEDPDIADMLHLLQRALHEPAEHSALKVEYLARALGVDVLVKYLSASRREPAPHQGRRLNVQQIRRVTSHIHTHLASEISLNELADIANLSRTMFIHGFKLSLKETPYQYIIHARIRRARSLLSRTRQSVANVALLCGFSDQAHFCRSFQKVTGLAPTAYRRQIPEVEPVIYGP
ncbi:MAG: AraC family transcriptional regulator [Methylobacillus sp.]|nr:AraC family transcriptional regulator [Methylobacillus sp.]